MARITIDLEQQQFEELRRAAVRAGRTTQEMAADLVKDALDPWKRASEIIERARSNAAMDDPAAEQLALSEVEALRRERRAHA